MTEGHGEKIWCGKYQGAQGALKETNRHYREWRRLRRSNLRKVAIGISIASDFYSAAGNHFALAKKALREKAWLDAALCGASGFNHLLTAHNIVAQVSDERRYLPLHRWNADQFDVAASIMYRCFRRRFARHLAELGVATYEREPERYKPHTLPLLRLHLARTEKSDRALLQQLQWIERLAPKAAEQDKAQGSRIYRGLSEQYKERAMRCRPGITRDRCLGNATRFGFEAARLARESGATDQLIKMGAKV